MRQSLELNEAFYHHCIAPILAAHCPAVAKQHAAALIGWGSEVLGNDDDFSKRYGWGPRIVFLLPEDVYTAERHQLAQVLKEQVPLTFEGIPTRFTDPTQGPPQPIESAEGFLQIPITTCSRFLTLYLGLEQAALPLADRDWLLIPEAGLLRLTAGAVFHDGPGELTALRASFAYFPDNVWRYKLAYQWTLLAREVDLVGLCAARGDSLSAHIGVARAVERIIGLVFLLNRAYHPAYLKWVQRQFVKLPALANEIGPGLEEAMTSPDGASAMAEIHPILERLEAYQRDRLNLPNIDYKHPVELDRGFFPYDLQSITAALKETIWGELAQVSFQIGAVDQWINDQALLMNPVQLQAFRDIYDWDDPMERLFERNQFEHFL